MVLLGTIIKNSPSFNLHQTPSLLPLFSRAFQAFKLSVTLAKLYVNHGRLNFLLGAHTAAIQRKTLCESSFSRRRG